GLAADMADGSAARVAAGLLAAAPSARRPARPADGSAANARARVGGRAPSIHVRAPAAGAALGFQPVARRDAVHDAAGGALRAARAAERLRRGRRRLADCGPDTPGDPRP